MKPVIHQSQELDKYKEEARELLKKSGFPLFENIFVGIDSTLPFMGYTTVNKNNEPLIVVSKMAIDSGNVVGLLVHEMGHIYQTEQKHPSHNFPMLEKAIDYALQGEKLSSFQSDVLHNIVNCIEDIYADDVSFEIFKKFPQKTFPLEKMNEFFLSWVHKPLTVKTQHETWQNAEFVVDAAFAKANLVRNAIVDTDEKMEKEIEIFLQHVDSKNAKLYEYFETFFIQLPKTISETEFGRMVIEYIRTFLTLI